MTNPLYCTDANWSPTRWKSKILRVDFFLTALVLISLTNCCMPVRAHTLPVECYKAEIFNKDRFSDLCGAHFLCLSWPLSLACTLPFSFPLRSTHLILYTRMHSHKHPLFLSFASHTHVVLQGLQMCVLICFQHRLFSCQCADSEFSTHSYEIRVRDIRPIQ